MEGEGLPIRGVDLSKVPPIPQKRAVTFMNHYITQSSQFLNDLTSVAEEKLEKILNSIQQVEERVCILEGKLSSIPGLTDGITIEPEPEVVKPPEVVTQQPKASSIGTPTISDTPTEREEKSRAGTEQESQAEQVETVPSAVEEESPTMKVKDHPDFKIYFRMQSMGVPIDGIKQKMQIDGVDPKILDNPNAPPPTPDS